MTVPAEEDVHEATFMQWPNSRAVYDDPVFLRITQDTIAEIANTIAEFEPVIMLAPAEEHGRMRRLSQKVEVWDIPKISGRGILALCSPGKGMSWS